MGSREFLDFAVPWLVDDPSAIVITEAEAEGGGVVYEMQVDPEDMGKVIGKRGRIIRSLRMLTRAASQSEDRNATVELID
jgi:hypothetical protein